MSEDSQKTEEPTPRRLRKAKEQGDSGASTYAAQGVAFLVAVSLAPFAIGALGARTTQDLRQAIARSAGVAVAANAGKSLARMPTVAIATELVALLLPMLAAVALGGTIAHVAQTGGFIAGKRLTPNFSRINPVAGAKNLFSLVRAFAVARALIAGSLSGWLAYDGLRSHIADVAHVTGRPRLAGVVIAKVAGGLAWKIGLLGVLLGALDIGADSG
jgi:flagellar biosynthesis protein FlhB